MYKKILDIVLSLTIILLLIYMSSNDKLTIINLNKIALIAFIQIMFSFIPFKKQDVISISFMLIYFIVIFGRSILQYNVNYTPSSSYFDSFSAFSELYLSKALALGVYSLACLNIGVTIKKMNIKIKRKILSDNNYDHEIDYKVLKTSNYFIFLIAIVPAIINYYNNFIGISVVGDTNTILELLSGLMLPFFVILMITKKEKWTFVMAVLYYFPQLFWGGRGRPIIQLAIIFFIFVRFIFKRKIKTRHKLLAFVGGSLILNLFIVIKEFRGQQLSAWIFNFPTIYLETFSESNPILEVIYEMGVGLAPTAAAIKYVPDFIPIQYGKTIIYSITTAIPDLLGIRPVFMSTYGNIPNLISSLEGASFGGSILQDFFVNFMWFTPLIMIIVGYLIQNYSTKMLNETRLSKNLIYYSLMYPILWWPRSSIGFIFRYIAVTLIVPLLLYLFFASYYGKYKRGNHVSNKSFTPWDVK